MKKLLGVILLALAAAGTARSQFALYLVNGTLEQPVPRTYDLGIVEPGGAVTLPFRVRNYSTGPASLDFLQVNGSGFTVGSVAPVVLAPQQPLDFAVVFQSGGPGSYSASLDSVGIAVLLTATVPAELTYQLDTGTGVRPLPAAPVDFGTLERGASAVRRIILLNPTTAPLIAPVPLVTGAGFAITGPSPGGNQIQAGASSSFTIQFAPPTDGAQTGVLTLGNRTYVLTGVAVEPALPQPRISVSLPHAASAQQGTVSVNLDTASRGGGTGTVTLTFDPSTAGATDSGVAFASGGQSAGFTVSPGDMRGYFGTQSSAAFQTGTTAGTLTVTVRLDGNTDQQIITIAPAVVGISAAAGVRTTGAIEIDLTGFDNTRTASALAFTFFDSAGNAVGLGPIRADGAATFQSYFQDATSGTFLLKAVFPVAGDAATIQTFEASVTNATGAATTARTSFERIGAGIVGPSLRVVYDIHDEKSIVADDEVKTPVQIDSPLPDVSRFVILLGVERGMI